MGLQGASEPSHAIRLREGRPSRLSPSRRLCSGGLGLHGLPLHGPSRGLQGQCLVLGLRQRVDHGHVHIEVVGLLEPPATLVTGKVQLGLSLVLSHVVLEGCPLPALEAADFAPGGQGQVSAGVGAGMAARRCPSPHLLQRLGSRVAHLVDEKVLPLLEGLSALITDVVPHLCGPETQ